MKLPKWLKKNWVPITLGILIIIILGKWGCNEAAYRRNIKALDSEISELEKKNTGLDEEIRKATKAALAAEAVVAEKEKTIEENRLKIKDLQDRRIVVAVEIRELPPNELVERTREILECAQVELTEQGILFTEECARSNLAKLAEFSLIKEELELTKFSLTASQEALQFQKMATWNVYKIAWAQGSQILNYQQIIRKKDEKFDLCESQRRKSFWSGLTKGILIGAGITITIVGVKKIF